MAPHPRHNWRILAGAGINREDSDDELGVQDLSWEWIRGDEGNAQGKDIIGARYGNFHCSIGDCVLLKAEGYKEAWVAIICEFHEDAMERGEKRANFMWFSSDKEVRNKKRTRVDALKVRNGPLVSGCDLISCQNELYITPAFDINPLNSINGSARILSSSHFRALYPTGTIPSKSKDYGKMFVCRRGCNVRTATYTDEFEWEEIYRGADDLANLIERVKCETKATRSRKKKVEGVSEATGEPYECYGSEGEGESAGTPRKKRKADTGALSTSNSTAVDVARMHATPTHKRIVIKKPLEFTPIGTRFLSPSHTSSPFQVARMHLHVSLVPPSLPCREDAFAQVYSHLEAAISAGSGSCIYISGTPGTGKTATVREVVSQLHAAVEAEELDDFVFVEINGMKVTDPHQAYSMLWEALRGDRLSPMHALDLLEREFSSPSPRRVPCVVLMDELDQLVTKSQSVMYNFFNWPGQRHSRLIVLAVANTMDLPERTLSNKISSRMGLIRITFPGYTHDQLMKIIESRLQGVPGNLLDPDAIQFASRKVAAVSGDARRALDICRRAVEIAEHEMNRENQDNGTPSRKKKSGEAGRATPRPRGRVIINTIKQAINEATSSPVQGRLKSLPMATKFLLVALLARGHRSGLREHSLADVIEETKQHVTLGDHGLVRTGLLEASSRENKDAIAGERMMHTSRVLAFGVAAVELAEAGIVNLEANRGERTGKIRLIVSEDDVKLAFKDDLEVRHLGFR